MRCSISSGVYFTLPRKVRISDISFRLALFGQKCNRRLIQRQQIGVILRHINDPHVLSRQQLRCNLFEQSRLACPIFADDKQLFPTGHRQANIPGQQIMFGVYNASSVKSSTRLASGKRLLAKSSIMASSTSGIWVICSLSRWNRFSIEVTACISV